MPEAPCSPQPARPRPGDYVPGVGVVIADLARPPGYDTATPELREAFDIGWQRSESAHSAYRDAYTATGGRGARVRRLLGRYTDAYASMAAARDALTAGSTAAAGGAG